MPAPLPPVDPNVKVPGTVAAAAAAAEALHKQAYQTPASPQPDPTPSPTPSPTPEPTPAPSPEPQPVAPPAPQPEPAPQPQPAPAPAPAPQPQPEAKAPAAGDLTPDEWRHRYLSMEGRYKQSAQSLGAMQEQMSEMGDEMMRLQATVEQLRGGRGPAPQPQPTPAPAGLTPEEVQAYGPELVDVIQRAARAAVMPDLQTVHNGVQRVQQRVQQVSTQSLYSTLDEEVPNWREINNDPSFKAWCRLPDVYSNQLRGNLLKAAFTAGQASRVVAFFKGFLAEGQATGQLPDPSLQPAVPPRTATIPLEMLAAPGRAKPAPGDNTPGSPADKPIFNRAQISAFYKAVNSGYYLGREPEKNALEQQIFAAQREGRVR